MCERILEGRKRKNKDEEDEIMGFGGFGGYMEAKKSKLLDQYKETVNRIETKSRIFEGVAILVNGLTNPNANELKKLMAEHGGIYHGYQMSTTTHIIASNLAYAKTKNLGSTPIVKASWITDSIEFKKLLDYKRYLLFSNQTSMPKLNFPIISVEDKPKTASDPEFLEEFYNNSRLHLISTMGSEFKQLISQLREKSEGSFPERLNLRKRTNGNLKHHNSVIMHIDMDCFFVSVGLKDRPELVGKPVVVTHAKNGTIPSRPDRSKEIAMNLERIPEKVGNLDENSSMSEIACANYEARKFGIKNGMFLGTAIKLCPNLRTIPYNFEGYKEVALKLYETVATYTLNIEAVSCDEMYVDVTEVLNDTQTSIYEFGTALRETIFEKTGCTCSCGFGSNKLQARIATKKAKPNGMFHLQNDEVETYFSEIALSDLPGVGRATLQKLHNLNLKTCGDVQKTDLKFLQNEIGQKLGETLMDQSKGIDRRSLNYQHERKSVSAEINYGIRFKNLDEALNFFQNLSREVCKRLNDLKMKTRNLTLKLMVRATEAPIETAKFLGHGICDNITKSVTIPPTNDHQTIYENVKSIYDKLNIDFTDLRGIGIQLSKLEKNEIKNSILSDFLRKTHTGTSNVSEENQTKKSEIEPVISNKTNKDAKMKKNKTNGKAKTKSGKQSPKNDINKFLRNMGTPIKHNIDLNVLNELPEEIRNEIIKEYNLKQTMDNKIEKNVTSDVEKIETNVNTLFDKLTVDELKEAIKTWIEEETEPAEIDVELISEHFRQLAIDRKIEMLRVIFNFLHRTFSKLNCRWHYVYFTMLNTMQQGMVARYGGTLLVKRKFDCCK